MYRSIESLQEYVIISQNEPLIEVFFKMPSGKWELDFQDQLTGKVQLRSVAVELPLAEVYRKVGVGKEKS